MSAHQGGGGGFASSLLSSGPTLASQAAQLADADGA
jgi:hypothetical protein